jgi:hypothetical protein
LRNSSGSSLERTTRLARHNSLMISPDQSIEAPAPVANVFRTDISKSLF